MVNEGDLSKRSLSVMKSIGGEGRGKILLPKIQRSNLKLELTPRQNIPILPFPRQVGNQIVSPFRGSLNAPPQTSRVERSIDLTFGKQEEDSTPVSVRRNLNHQLSAYSLIQQRHLRQDLQQTLTQSVTQQEGSGFKIKPSEKTLAILKMHQDKKLPAKRLTIRNTLREVESQVRRLSQGQDEVRFFNDREVVQVSSDEEEDLEVIQDGAQEKGNDNAVGIQQEHSHQKDHSLLKNQNKKKKKVEIQEYMKLQGFQPSPLEFYKLVTKKKGMEDFFCYCNRRDDFYDFEIVPFTKRNDKEYLTVSKRGLTHFIKDTSPEFMSVFEFTRQANIFKQMNKICFFKLYKYRKTFTNWKTLMRRTMYTKTQNFLKRDLFILDAELSKPLLDLRMKTNLIQRVPIATLYCPAPVKMDEFLHTQQKQRKVVTEYLTKIEKDMSVIITDACKVSIKTFKEENRIALTDEFFGENEQEREAFLVGDETHKQMPYTQEATMRTHYRRLSRYIQLADVLIAESKLNIVLNTIKDIEKTLSCDYAFNQKHYIGDNKVQACAIFEIRVDYLQNELKYSPTYQELQLSILQSIIDGFEVIKQYKPFLDQEIFQQYGNVAIRDEIFNEHQDSLSLALTYEDVQRLLVPTIMKMREAFEELSQVSQLFQKPIKAYLKNHSNNFNEARMMEQDAIHMLIAKLEKQLEKVNKLDVKQTILILKMDGETLKDQLKNSQVQCISSLKSLIPKIQFDRFQEIFVALSKDYQKISMRPRKIDDYVALMNSLRELTGRMDHYQTQFHEADQFGILMEENRIKFPERNRTKLKETQALLIDTKRTMIEVFESSQSQKSAFKKELIEMEVPLIQRKIVELREQLKEEGIFESKDTDIDFALKRLQTIGDEVKKAKDRGVQLNQFEKFLDIEETLFEGAGELYEEWYVKNRLWESVKLWNTLSQKWLETRFSEIDADDITQRVDKFSKLASMCAISMKENKMAQSFRESVDSLNRTVPVVFYLRDEALQERHWEEIFQLLQIKPNLNDPEFTLNSLIELKVHEHKEKIEEVAMKANQERELEKKIEKLNAEWKKVVLDTKQHKEQYFILIISDQISTMLEDSLMQLHKMLANRFIERVRAETENLYKKLQYLENLLVEWMSFQRSWIYLENIFNSADIANKLGSDSKRFTNLDKQWKEIMKQTNANPIITRVIAGYNQLYAPGQNVLHLSSSQINFYEIFKEGNKTLDEILKSLEILLDKKRSDFPRFYFLSNDELLLVLSKGSKDPQSLQPQLRKIFENIATIELDMDDITRVWSVEREELKIRRVKATGIPVEKWLSNLLDSISQGVKRSIKEAMNSYKDNSIDFKRHQWAQEEFTAQAICVVSSIIWTANTEQILKTEDEEEQEEGLSWWQKENNNQLQDLISLICNSQLEGLKKRAIIALITQDVHYRDIIDELYLKCCITSLTHEDFIWQKQVRYYYQNDDVSVNQVNSSFDYGNEYLGATTRIVITPLTDRCWLTITGALHFRLGAAPAGPAGTGKTESVKDLAKGLGKFCVVFNCSNQINFKMMEFLFTGLAMTGAWACLDEFNRINIEVLSVIAQQIQLIRAVQVEKPGYELILGSKVVDKFVPSLGIFITMNPGYKGRTELPENLKILFRPVSMMIPDYSLIAEIILYSQGFQSAKFLSKKITKVYSLASEQLSQQIHYDFGMRALKSVLVMAGQLKTELDKQNESVLLIKAIIDTNMPKLVKDDEKLFEAILRDLFPQTKIEPIVDQEMLQRIQMAYQVNDLSYSDSQVAKIIQLNDTIKTRFGVMIIGETLTGKTAILKLLLSACNSIGKSVESQVLNPKSISMDQLYGQFSHETQEWKDGIGSSIIRKFAESDDYPNKHCMKWVIFDGPVDATWIENMNTVLDDNLTLCLSNGERIKLKPQMRMIFEIDDLSQASPATVSRCGMVYTNRSSLNWRPIVQTWLGRIKEMSSKNKEYIWNLFEGHVENTLDLLSSKGYQLITNVTPNNIVLSLCSIMKDLLIFEIRLLDFEIERQRKAIKKVFIFSLALAFGGIIDSQHHSSFEVYMGNSFSNPQDLPKSSIFDNQLCIRGNGPSNNIVDYTQWTKQLVDEKNYKSSIKEKSIFIETKDSLRFKWLIHLFMKSQQSLLIVGQQGVGKSEIVKQSSEKLRETFQIVSFSFSQLTSQQAIIYGLEDQLERRRRNLIGGINGMNVLLIIDDVSMPKVDQYGTQQSIELLREIIEQKGFYDTEGLFWKQIDGTTFLGISGPSQQGKGMTSRFSNKLTVIGMPRNDEESIVRIFTCILQTQYQGSQGFKKEVLALTGNLVDATAQLHFKVVESFKPTPKQYHYQFNLRDPLNVIKGLCMAKSGAINNSENFGKLWINECSKVYLDRLSSASDKYLMRELILSILKSCTRIQLEQEQAFEAKKVQFVDFMQRGLPYEDRSYQLLADPQKIQHTLLDYLDEYNILHPALQLNIVLFTQFIDSLISICRVLRTQRGNSMLIGITGLGKQTVSTISSFISQCKTFQISSQLYSETKEKFKKIIIEGGVRNQRTVVIVGDQSLKAGGLKDHILEDIYSLMITGNIPNLYSQEEKEDILKEVRQEALESGIREKVFEDFILKRARESIHVIMTVSPVGNLLRNLFRDFPQFISKFQLQWMEAWPQEAMVSIGQRYLDKNTHFKETSQVDQMCAVSVALYISLVATYEQYQIFSRKNVYLTPSLYIDYLVTFQALIEKISTKINTKRRELSQGLDKLKQTNEQILLLSRKMVMTQPLLNKSIEDIEVISMQLEQDRKYAHASKLKIEEEKRIVDRQTSEVKEQYDQAVGELNSVMPALIDAEDALNTLNSSDITELRGTKFPSKGIFNTMVVTYMLLEKKSEFRKIEWKHCQQMMAVSFFEKLKNFNKEELVAQEKLIKQIELFMGENQDFTPEFVKNSSKACFSLCKWCFAIVNYSNIARNVAPKQQHVKVMEKQLAVAQQKLDQMQESLNQQLQQVNELERHFFEIRNKRERLQMEIESYKDKIVRANKIIEGLKSESERWLNQVQQIDEGMQYRVGNAIIGAATVVYLGALDGRHRKIIADFLIEELAKNQILYEKEALHIQFCLSDPLQFQAWVLNSLPQDQVSITNAVIIKNTIKKVYIIDPQKQAYQWICQAYAKEKKSKFQSPLSMSDKNSMKVIEQSIVEGNVLLILDQGGSKNEESLNSLLQCKPFRNQHGRNQVQFNNQAIDFNPGFHFLMLTFHNRPNLTPEFFLKVTVVDFSVTREGLEDQLLAYIVQIENPEIEQKRASLTLTLIKAEKKIAKIQSDILLQLVSSNEIKLLEDDQLLFHLDTSKHSSEELMDSMKMTKLAQVQIQQQRELYLPLAERGSLIFFVISNFNRLNHMYQLSLSTFCDIFLNHIRSSQSFLDDQKKRMLTLIRDSTRQMYMKQYRGLFKDHQLLLAFMIAVQIGLKEGTITEKDWAQFVHRTPKQQDAESDYQLTRKQMKPFQDVLNVLEKQPECLREGIAAYVSSEIGVQTDEQQSQNLRYAVCDSSKANLLLILQARDVEALQEIQDCHAQCASSAKLIIISLGQGQDVFVLQALKKFSKTGGWLVLQNCHLYESFLITLESEVLSILNECAPTFKLILTTSPCEYFPIQLLQASTRVSIESESGIKSRMRQAIYQIVENQQTQPDQPILLLKYNICLFHSVINERKKFGKLGWNIPYKFSESDLEIALKVVDSGNPNGEYLRYMIGNIIYGGRITDLADKATLMTILDKHISQINDKQVNFDTDYLTQLVDLLPDIDLPEQFGMSPSSYLNQQLLQANILLSELENITSHDAKYQLAVDSNSKLLTVIDSLLKDMPQPFTRDGANKELFKASKDGLLPPLSIFLIHEVARFNNLYAIMRSSLALLQKVLKGLEVMGEEEERIINALSFNKVPEKWALYPSQKSLSSWFVDLRLRTLFIQNWLNTGSPLTYRIGAFFFPQGFLTSILQNYSRRTKIPINDLTFEQNITDLMTNEDLIERAFDKSTLGEAILISGLFLQCGIINRETLQLEDEPQDGKQLNACPIILFRPILQIEENLSNGENQETKNVYNCPLYKTSERAGTLSSTGHSTNFIINIDIESEKEASHWRLRGTALLCSLDD